jgi:hypothetical protein
VAARKPGKIKRVITKKAFNMFIRFLGFPNKGIFFDLSDASKT